MPANPLPVVIGHRGASGYRPEHTRAAYELAFQLGADAVEPDIVSTRDGVLVLRHENEISATTDVAAHPEFANRRTTKSVDGATVSGWFTEDFTWAELATLRARERLGSIRQASSSFDGMYPILRLSDLFELVSAKSDEEARLLGIVAEIKHATYFESIGLPLDELFAAELAASDWGRNPALIVESFEMTVLARLHDRGYRGKRVYLVERTGAPADRVAVHGASAAPYSSDVSGAGLFALAGANSRERVDGISVDAKMLASVSANSDGDGSWSPLGAELVDQSHAAGLAIYAWTLRPENRYLPTQFRVGDSESAYGRWYDSYRALMSTGVDGVFADNPDLAVVARDGLHATN